MNDSETPSLTYGSLFTGIGGFDLGHEQAGLECKWQVERDKYCNRVLRRHWPERSRGELVEEVTRDRFERVDVICGGFPCQDLSVAGRRAGLAGARSGLWHEFRRIVTEFTPEFVEIENVPGLLSSNGGRDFLTVIRGLEELGYSVAWTVLDSQYRGVAQRRERVFIIGSLGNGSCAEILFEPESVRGDTPPSREKRESATRDVALCLNSGRDGYNDGSDQTYISSARMTAFGEYVDDGSASTLKERDYKDATDLVVGFSSKDHGADAQNDKSPTLRSMNFDKSHIDGGGQAAIVQWASGGGKLENPSAQALRAGAEHNYQFARVGMSVRRLTPRECERLQGFPDDWTRWDQDGKEISDSARYRMLGNAVTVPVARWLGERMLMTADRCRIGSI